MYLMYALSASYRMSGNPMQKVAKQKLSQAWCVLKATQSICLVIVGISPGAGAEETSAILRPRIIARGRELLVCILLRILAQG